MKRFIYVLLWAVVSSSTSSNYVVTENGKPILQTKSLAEANRYVAEGNKSAGKYKTRNQKDIDSAKTYKPKERKGQNEKSKSKTRKAKRDAKPRTQAGK